MESNIEKLMAYVEKNRELLLTTERYIWSHPEIGYKEWGTSAYLEKEFEKLGYTLTKAGDIPGFIADLDTGRPGPKVAILGELDSLICATHPEANPETKAMHACGHHCQTTMVLGCAAAFKEEDALKDMCGSIRFVIVPAEETIDLEFRSGLLEKGTIHYVAGKIEFLYRGLFDGVDMAMMVHVENEGDYLFEIIDGSDGCITKHFEYQGVAAHAGAAPHDGVNALYAASLGMTACNSIRETFREKDYVRFHPIITQAGVAANAIPNVAKMDAYVRASSVEVMLETNKKINRALTASAAAVGANLSIHDTPGNLPYHSDKMLMNLFRESVTELFGEGVIFDGGWNTGSSDIGDISSIMPAIQPLCAGASGKGHGEDYEISDPEKAVINPTKVLVMSAYKLLSNDGKIAKEVIANYKPVYADKTEYFQAVNSMEINKKTVNYKEDGTIILDFQNN